MMNRDLPITMNTPRYELLQHAVRGCRWSSASTPLYLREAAVDEELGAGDVAGGIGREERDGLGDLLGSSGAAERHRACKRRVQLLARRPVNPSSPGGKIGPGLTTLTRILRTFRSVVNVRANERNAALVAL